MSLIDYLKEDFKKLLILFIAVLVIFKVVYLKESVFSLSKLVLSYFYLYILPGCLFLISHRSIKYSHRLILGFGLGLALTNIITYLLSLFFNVSIYISIYLVPLILIIISLVYSYKKS